MKVTQPWQDELADLAQKLETKLTEFKETQVATSGLGTRNKWGLGACWSRKAASRKLCSFKDLSQDLRWGCRADKAQCGYHNTKAEDQKGFLPHFVRVWEYIVTGFVDVGL